MAGLLDFFQDPNTRFSLGLLAAAGPTERPQNIGQRLYGLLGALDQQRNAEEDRKLKAQLAQAQLADLSAQAQQRTIDAQQKQRRMGMLDQWMQQSQGDLSGANADTVRQTGDLAPTMQNAQVQGAAMQQRQQSNPLFGIPPQAIAASLALEDGKSVPDWLFKRGTPNIDFVNGVAMDKNRVQAGTSVPTISQNGQASQLILDPSAPGGFRVIAPAGALDTYGAYRSADEAAKAGSDLVKRYNPDTGREEYVSRAQALRASQPGTEPPQAAQAWPSRTTPGQALPQVGINVVRNDLQNPATQFSSPAARAAVMQLAGMQQPGAGGFPGPMAAGPSAAELRVGKTLDAGNEAFMKESYTPTQAAGKAAGDMLVSVTTARNALRNLGATGWGTPTMAAAASVLGSLGVPQASRFASNAQVFQQAAMERLWSTLGEQKGPQTEGDADRAAKTFAQLKNQPAANLYILDLAQAKAERDRIRANFFREGLPLGQRAGDLQMIEREWQAREPSIFDMPSMKKWAAQ